MTTGLAGDATELADSVFADVSALKYATTTVTLAAAPTTNFCIGEILTTNDSRQRGDRKSTLDISAKLSHIYDRHQSMNFMKKY